MPPYSDADSKNGTNNRTNNGNIGGFGIIGEKKNFDGGPRGKINKPNDKTPVKNRDKFSSDKMNLAPNNVAGKTNGLNIINSKELYSLLH
jgi:hypothetical protein